MVAVLVGVIVGCILMTSVVLLATVRARKSSRSVKALLAGWERPSLGPRASAELKKRVLTGVLPEAGMIGRLGCREEDIAFQAIVRSDELLGLYAEDLERAAVEYREGRRRYA